MSQTSTAKSKAPYLPRSRTAGYAVLVALFFEEKKRNATMWTKEHIADLAYPKWTDTEMIKKTENRKDKGKANFFDGWSSVTTTLISKHKLVEKINRKPSQGMKTDHFKLTDEGRERAEMLIEMYGLDPSGPHVEGAFGIGVTEET